MQKRNRVNLGIEKRATQVEPQALAKLIFIAYIDPNRDNHHVPRSRFANHIHTVLKLLNAKLWVMHVRA